MSTQNYELHCDILQVYIKLELNFWSSHKDMKEVPKPYHHLPSWMVPEKKIQMICSKLLLLSAKSIFLKDRVKHKAASLNFHIHHYHRLNIRFSTIAGDCAIFQGLTPTVSKPWKHIPFLCLDTISNVTLSGEVRGSRYIKDCKSDEMQKVV